MLKKAFEIFVGALIVAGVAGVYFRFAGGVPFRVTQTSTYKASTFDVSGEGKATVAPDRANVVMGVHETAGKVSTAQQAADKTMKNLVTELKKLGIEEKDIKTTNYNIYPDYSNGARPSGYVVNSQVSVKIANFEVIPDVLDLAGKLGLEQVGQLSFSLSDELKEKTLSEARKEAVDAAKKKAENLASLSGVRLGKIVNVTEGSNNNYPVPLYKTTDAVGLGEAEPARAQVNPGTSEMSVTVTLSYETE